MNFAHIISRFILTALIFFFIAGCFRKGERPENFYFGAYSEAETLYQRGEYEKAIQRYQSYIDENPEGNLSVISQYYIAKSYAAIGNADEARSRFEYIKRTYPELVWANFSATQLEELSSLPKKTEKKV